MKIEDLFPSNIYKTKIKFIPDLIDCLQIIKTVRNVDGKKEMGWFWRFDNKQDKCCFQCFVADDFWYKNQWCSMIEIFKQLKNQEIEITYRKNEKIASFVLEKYIKEEKKGESSFIPKIEVKKEKIEIK